MSRGKYDIWSIMVSDGSIPHDWDPTFHIYNISQSPLKTENEEFVAQKTGYSSSLSTQGKKRVSWAHDFEDSLSSTDSLNSLANYCFLQQEQYHGAVVGGAGSTNGTHDNHDAPTYLTAFYSQARRLPQFLVNV